MTKLIKEKYQDLAILLIKMGYINEKNCFYKESNSVKFYLEIQKSVYHQECYFNVGIEPKLQNDPEGYYQKKVFKKVDINDYVWFRISDIIPSIDSELIFDTVKVLEEIEQSNILDFVNKYKIFVSEEIKKLL